jgi:hypothetical protein
MVVTRRMGRSIDQLTHGDAARMLRWWLETGVDTAIAEEPRQWLKPTAATRNAAVAPGIAGPSPQELPAEFNAFRSFLETATGLPLDRAGARRVLPHGLAGARGCRRRPADRRRGVAAGDADARRDRDDTRRRRQVNRVNPNKSAMVDAVPASAVAAAHV